MADNENRQNDEDSKKTSRLNLKPFFSWNNDKTTDRCGFSISPFHVMGFVIIIVTQVLFILALKKNCDAERTEDIIIPILEFKLSAAEQYTAFLIAFTIDMIFFIIFTLSESMALDRTPGPLQEFFAPYSYTRNKSGAWRESAALGLCAFWRSVYELSSTFVIILYTLVMTHHQTKSAHYGVIWFYYLSYLFYHVVSRDAVRSFSVDIQSRAPAVPLEGAYNIHVSDRKHKYSAIVVFDGALQHLVKLLVFSFLTFLLHSKDSGFATEADESLGDGYRIIKIAVVIFWISLAFHETLTVMSMLLSLINRGVAAFFQPIFGCIGLGTMTSQEKTTLTENLRGSEPIPISFTGEQFPLMKRAVNVSPGFVI
jgi:hypothetical protein